MALALSELNNKENAVPSCCLEIALKSKDRLNKLSSVEMQPKLFDKKKFAKRKRLSKSPEKKRKPVPVKENIDESMEQSDVAEDLLENFPVINEHFDVLSMVGEGTFSKVYLARSRLHPEEMVAIKHIVPTSSPTRVKNELSCLQCFGGKNNISGVKTTLRNNDHTAFMLPYFKHEKFQTYFQRFTTSDIKEYMRNLFTALKQVHSYNIIHRDVKPSNFLYSKDTKTYLLVDFGLAMQVPGTTGILSNTDDVSTVQTASRANDAKQSTASSRTDRQELQRNAVKNSLARGDRVASRATVASGVAKKPADHSSRSTRSEIRCKYGNQPGHSASSICSFCCSRSGQVAPRAGTPGFRSPEVLMKLPNQTTAVDIWSAGIILLSFLSGRYPFFKAKDDLASLAQIIAVFGSEEVSKAGNMLGKDLICSAPVKAHDLQSLCERLRQKSCRYHSRKKKKRKCPLKDSVSKRCKPKEACILDKGELRLDSSAQPIAADNDTESRFNSSTDSLGLGKGSPRLDSSNNAEDSSSKINTGIEMQSKDEQMSVTAASSIRYFDCHCIPPDAYDLLSQCLQLDPLRRITAEEALQHRFLVS
eukprot:gene16231-17868_t